MANIVLPFVTTYDDKGAKKADLSLKGLMKTQLGMGVSAAAVAQQIGKAVKAFAEDEAQQKQLALAVQNSTGASNAQVQAIEDTIQSMHSRRPCRTESFAQPYRPSSGPPAMSPKHSHFSTLPSTSLPVQAKTCNQFQSH